MKQIKLIIAMVLITVLFALSVNAGFQTVFNPFTGKLDYTRNLNWSSDNVSFGNLTTDNIYVGGGYSAGGTTLYSNGSGYFSDDVLVDGEIITVNGTIIQGNIVPGLDNTYSVGNSSNKWNATYSYKFLAENGTAANPSITFRQDSDTGFYDMGSNNLGISFAGNLRWGLTANYFYDINNIGGPALRYGAYSVSAPSHTFTSDYDTGIARVNANNLSLITHGVEQVRVSNETQVVTYPNNRIPAWDNAAGTGLINGCYIGSDDQMYCPTTMNVGPQILTKDQLNVRTDMPCTADAVAGTECGWVDSIDGTNILKINASSDGAGGIDTERLSLETGIMLIERTTTSATTLVKLIDFGNFSIAHNTTHGCLVSDSGNEQCVAT